MNYIELKNDVNVTGLVSAFRYYFNKDFHFEGEKHVGWEFVYVESGKIKSVADNKTYIIKSGELICHKPMEFHDLHPYHGDASVVIFCFYCNAEKMQFFENKILSVNQHQRIYINDIVTHAEKFLKPKKPLEISKDGYMEKSISGTSVNSQFIKNTIELLILSLFSSQSTKIAERANTYSQHLKRKKLTEGIKLYLETNLGKRICLDEIAEEFSYSVSTVKTVFKKETGKGVFEYYNVLRLKAAKEMLKKKSHSINEISENLGFNNTSHFSNFFKKYTGHSPKHFSH